LAVDKATLLHLSVPEATADYDLLTRESVAVGSSNVCFGSKAVSTALEELEHAIRI